MTKAKGPIEKVTLNLYQGDKETIQKFYSTMGWSVAAREVIHNFCNGLREKDSQEVLTETPSLDVDLSTLEL